MLSGGQGDIRPVMGGGFSLMALGQPEIPSLMGGDVPPAPIVAVGGANPGGFGAAVDNRAAAEAAAHKERVKLIHNPRVEFYKLDKTADILDKYSANVLSTMLKQSTTDVNEVLAKYTEKQVAHWGEPNTIKGDNCPSGHDIKALRNLVHFIPTEGADVGSAVETIVILPPVAGNLARFDYLVTFLSSIGVMSNVQDEIGTLAESTRVVFMPPFYGNLKTSEGIAHDLTLNYMFMKFKAINGNKVFVLAEHTPANIEVGCTLKQQYGLPQGAPIANLLEPSHIIYKSAVATHAGILITSSAKHNGLPLDPLAGTKHNIFIEAGEEPHGIGSYLTFTSAAPNTVVTPGPSQVGQCAPLIADVSASTVSTPFGFASGDKVVVVRLYAPRENRKPLCRVKNSLDGLDRFFSAEMNRIARAHKTSVTRDGKLYRIRKHSGKVQSNWMAGVFTPGGTGFSGEADFLNDLGLSPKLLRSAFGEIWGDKLSEFLKAVSISRCFSDEALLTYRECDKARAFVAKVESHLVEKGLDNIKVVDPASEIPKTMNADEAILEEATPGKFVLEIEFGQHKVYPTLTGSIMPVMIVSNSTSEYLLRNLVVNKITDEDTVKTILERYKQRYPGWKFIT